MNDDLPDRMPPRPSAIKVPRVFNIWGTIAYGGAAITSIVVVITGGIFNWTPPWSLTGAAFIYVFVSSGIICLGRIEANKDAKFFIRALMKKSEENKRRLN